MFHSYNMASIVLFFPYMNHHGIFKMKGIQGVSKIKDGYNPATWMLEVTSPAQELALGVDFSDLYKNSDLYRWVHRIY